MGKKMDRLLKTPLVRRHFLKASAFGAATLAAPNLIRSARASQEIVLYSWETYHEDLWLEEWTKTTGIPTRVIRAGTVDEMFAGMISGSVQPDILWFDLGSIKRYVDAKLVSPVDPDRLSNLGMITRGLKWEEMNSLNGKIWGIPYNWGTQPLMFNADIVKEKPDSWSALWDSRYAGKVLMFDDAYITFPMIALATGAKDPYNLSDNEFNRCTDALRRLRAQVVTLARGWNDGEVIYANDEAIIGYCQNISIPHNLQKKGKNFSYVFPREGTPTWVDSAFITQSGDREEVYRFIDDNLSTKWQARFVEFSSNNGILSAEEARKTGMKDEILMQTNILEQDEPDFWPKLSLFAAPEDIDRRVQIWNDFKAGAL